MGIQKPLFRIKNHIAMFTEPYCMSMTYQMSIFNQVNGGATQRRSGQ